MGTHSTLRIADRRGNTYAIVYTQFDGYPSGVGLQVAEFLMTIALTNGIPSAPPTAPGKTRWGNGAGCVAAQLIAHLKERPGNIYLLPVVGVGEEDTETRGEEYNYTVVLDMREGEIRMRENEMSGPLRPVEDFARWCREADNVDVAAGE